ncbi:MAG: hypothetical protein ACRDHL_02650 [Candidatus Promineifilaceae bacterium]
MLRIRIAISLLLGALIFAGVAEAGTGRQEELRGSIRGTVYEDRNADGACVGSGEPVMAGVNIEFSSGDGSTTVFLQSGLDGTYGLASVGLGTWLVTARPDAGLRVTSENPRQVVLTSEQALAEGVDFCIARGSAPAGTGTLLPESGAGLAPTLALGVLAGLALISAGALLRLRQRRSS